MDAHRCTVTTYSADEAGDAVVVTPLLLYAAAAAAARSICCERCAKGMDYARRTLTGALSLSYSRVALRWDANGSGKA